MNAVLDGSQISQSDSGEFITIKAPKKSASFSKLPPPSPNSPSPPSTPIVRYARSPCDSCGHHNIPIMTHPISPLAKSQTNLELMEVNNARQALLPMSEEMHRDESSYSLAVPQTLQVSRRPSVLLQEILGGRKDHGGVFGRKKSAHAGNINGTVTGSTITIQGDNGAKSFQAKQSKVKNRRQGNDAISAALSATYCKLLVLLGVCLPITEVITEQIPTYVYQGFYVYLYALSIIFIVFVYISAFRNRTLINALKSYHEKNNVLLKHKVTHFGSFYLRVGAIAFAIGTMVYSGLEFGQFFELSGQPGCRDVFVAITPLCRMILCIGQVQFIFLNTTYLDMARHKVFSRFGLMHMVATNLCEWLYVLVEETKHEIFHIGHHDVDPEHDPALKGGPHGGVDWSAVNASLHEANHIGHNAKNSTIAAVVGHVLKNITAASVTTTETPTALVHGCSRTTIMGALVQKLSPFLFPCTIEYSLICAVILYEMWKTVKSIPDIDKSRKNSIKPVQQKPAHHFSVDCSQSHKGLFFGILIIVMTIISMIMYFVLYMQPGYELIATQEVTLWETAMYFMCGAAIVTGMILMRDLRYIKDTSNEHHSMELDNLLLIVAQTGVYLYGMFSILGSYFSKWDTVPDRVEGIIAEMFSILQTSLQTMFILHASHRRCKGSNQVRKKPGREIITFLLVANMAIWFINTLIKGRAVFRQTHMEFYGAWAWTIITHVSMPLAIFYRFHSTICLFEVWKITYKAKAH
ncbi:otopetrin-like b isoform X3 [Haematobia irritans]|uniref:otopetrin-like b isoform X3 n=1 Tax=Haematobia irritans TaxID=7368 RepID=UPI003F4F5A6A